MASSVSPSIVRRVKSVTHISPTPPEAEIVNRREKDVVKDAEPGLDLSSLPPVATFGALLLILIYCLAEPYGIRPETHVAVSWTKVVKEKQFWRIFVAHFFHVDRLQLMINVTSFMALGRYLERKIRPIPMILLIQAMGSVSNLVHMLISQCFTKTQSEITFGFSHVIFALKMIQVLAKDAGQRRGPTLLLGVVPVYLGALAPWEPLLESVLTDVVVKGKNFATHFSGIIAGLSFPFLDYCFHDLILVPSKITITFTPSSQAGNNTPPEPSSSTEQLDRVMKLLTEDESRVELFHELPSTECLILFRRRLPMTSKSLQNHSKSDSGLFLN